MIIFHTGNLHLFFLVDALFICPKLNTLQQTGHRSEGFRQAGLRHQLSAGIPLAMGEGVAYLPAEFSHLERFLRIGEPEAALGSQIVQTGIHLALSTLYALNPRLPIMSVDLGFHLLGEVCSFVLTHDIVFDRGHVQDVERLFE